MKAIITKYHGPTNTRGSRITAKAEGVKGVSISYPYDLSGEACHLAAATALCEKYHWLDKSVQLVGGGLPDETGYAFCFVRR